MRIKIASSILATAAATTLPVTALASAVAISAPESDSPSTTGAHRLLQRFKDRHSARHLSTETDVGILGGRFLEDTDYEYYCPRDTCPSDLCDCADQGGSLEDCTSQLQNVCIQGKLSDCVYEGYIAVYEAVYCPFVSCLGEGFLQNQCDCAFYDLYCDRLNGEECMNVVPDADGGADKKPFFGCDETEMQTVCDQAKVCKDNGDLNGLPELGQWVGINKNGGGTRSLGVVAGVTFLSSIIWVLNN